MEVFPVPVAVEELVAPGHGAALQKIVRQLQQCGGDFQTLHIEVRQGLFAAPGAQDGTGYAAHSSRAAGMVGSHDHGAVKIPLVNQGCIHRTGQNIRAGVAFELLHGIHGENGKIVHQLQGMPDSGNDLGSLAVFPAELVVQGLQRLLDDLAQGGTVVVEAAGDDVGNGGTGQKCQGIAVGQCHAFGTQPVDLLLVHPLGIGKKTGSHGGGNAGGGIPVVDGGFQGAQLAPDAVETPVQSFHHPGVGAVAAAQLRDPEDPAVVPGGLVVATLADGPFLLAQACVHHIGGHFSVDLAPGQTQQQTVAGEGGQLGMGGNFRIAIDQIVAQQSVGTVVLPDLRPGFGVDGVAHGIAHRQTQQTAPVCAPFYDHTDASLSKKVHYFLLYPGDRKKARITINKLEFVAQSTPICHCEGRKARGNLQQDGMII